MTRARWALTGALCYALATIAPSAQVTVQRGFNAIFPFGATSATAVGVLTVNTTSAGTGANTTETDLWTYSLPANALNADGKAVRITAWFTTAANANNKTARLYFGGTNVKQRTTSVSGAVVMLKALVFRTGASAQLAIGHDESTSGSADVSNSTPAGDTTTALTIKASCQNGTAAANDCVFRGAIVEALN